MYTIFMDDLAPIVFSTYRRLEHLKKSISALQANPLAGDSIIYITSDGPMPGHEVEVFKTREYLKQISGFRKIKLFFYEQNDRSQIWSKRRDISRKHGCYIHLEEDNVPAKCFLEYMNQGLKKFERDENVFSIGAYLPPIFKNIDSDSVYRVPNFFPWGFATWERADSTVRETLTPDEFGRLLGSSKFRRNVNKSYSLGYIRDLKRISNNGLHAYDQMVRLEMLMRDMYSIFPSNP